MIKIFDIFKKKKEEKQVSKVSWDEIKDIMEPYKRKAWFPKVAQQASDPSASKFSGIPALLKNESWPCCANCQEPMQLFVQLNSKRSTRVSKRCVRRWTSASVLLHQLG